MFTEKMARITSEFTAQILEVLREACREELSTRSVAEPAKVAAKAHRLQRAPKPPKPAKVVAKTAPTPKVSPALDGKLTTTALAFFAERGRKGGTADQLSAHLVELGLPHEGEAVLAQLAGQSAVREAGFRRSTGTGHRTMPVYVAV